MPDPNNYDNEEEFMHVCIPKVLEDGTAKDNDQAVAICMNMWKEKKSVDVEVKAIPSDNPGDYLIVEDREKKTTWHLQVKEDGIPNHRLMGAAWAALHSGFRGNKYEGPGKEEAIGKLKRLYAAEEMAVPSEKSMKISPKMSIGELLNIANSILTQEEYMELGKDATVGDLYKTLSAKIGSRHSKVDQDAIQEIHDKALFLGAVSPPQPKQDEIISFPLGNYDTDKALVWFGDAVKALGDGKIGGYLIRFSSDNDPDLTGQFFTKDTDFGDLETGTVYYQHGLDEKLKTRKLSKATHKVDDFGVWAETQLAMRDEYEKFIYSMAEAGKMGWSSGTAAHLVELEPVGKAIWIKKWPLGLDDTLTPTPAEPRNTAIPLKSYLGVIQQPTLENRAEDAGDAPQVDGGAEKIQTSENNKEVPTMELTQEKIDKIVEAGDKVIMLSEAIKNLPTVNQAGVQVIHDEADTPFKTFGDQLAAVKNATLTQGRELAPRLKALNIKQLGANELVGSEGGFLLEPSFVAGLLTPLHDTGPFSSRVARLPIGPNANGVIIRAVDETSRADGSRWGGVKGYRLSEAGTKLATQPTFRLVELRLKKYAVLIYATEELLQDTTALGSIVQQSAAEELDFMANDDILNGLGVGGPLGILNSGALVTVTKEGGQLADTVVTQNIFKMWARMHPRSKSNSVWFINSDVTPQLYGLNLTVGTGGMPMYMAPGSLPNAPSGALLGRPVVETEFNPTLGDAGDVLLADMSQYAFIERDVQAASSIHVQFLTDQVAYRFVFRCDGQPKMAAPLTPYKGAGTLSPFVALGARA